MNMPYLGQPFYVLGVLKHFAVTNNIHDFKYKVCSLHSPPPTPSNLLTPAECLTIQLNSDTVYLEIASDSAD